MPRSGPGQRSTGAPSAACACDAGAGHPHRRHRPRPVELEREILSSSAGGWLLSDRTSRCQRPAIVAPHSSGLTSRACAEKSQWWPSRSWAPNAIAKVGARNRLDAIRIMRTLVAYGDGEAVPGLGLTSGGVPAQSGSGPFGRSIMRSAVTTSSTGAIAASAGGATRIMTTRASGGMSVASGTGLARVQSPFHTNRTDSQAGTSCGNPLARENVIGTVVRLCTVIADSTGPHAISKIEANTTPGTNAEPRARACDNFATPKSRISRYTIVPTP
jgi:hypothetical protein